MENDWFFQEMPKNLTYDKFLMCFQAGMVYKEIQRVNRKPTFDKDDKWQFQKDMKKYEEQEALNQQAYKKYQQDCAKAKNGNQTKTVNMANMVKVDGCNDCGCGRSKQQAIQTSYGRGSCCCGHPVERHGKWRMN